MNAKEITYNFLFDMGELTSYTNHISHFKELFSMTKVDTFLEFGCGYSTKYFIDNCEKVISVEFQTDGTDLEWMEKCRLMFADCENWEGIDYIASKKFSDACGHQCSAKTDPAKVDPTYVTELDGFIKSILSQHRVDVAFVDAGIYIRGDMVELLLQNKVPIVIAHDTASDDGKQVGQYGWFKIKSLDNYEKIFISYGNGTTFFIDKKEQALINKIKAYQLTFN